jgi:hypothetical protein
VKYRRRREPQSALLRLERNFANYSAILPPLKSSLRFVRVLKTEIDRILFATRSAPARLRAYQAASPALARLLRDGMVSTYGAALPSALACLQGDFEPCIASSALPTHASAGDPHENIAGSEQVTRRRSRVEILCTHPRSYPCASSTPRGSFPPGGFRSVFLQIDAFHRERRIPVRRGQNRHKAEQFHIDSVSQTPLLPMHSAIASVVSDPRTREAQAGNSATSSDAPAVTRQAEED